MQTEQALLVHLPESLPQFLKYLCKSTDQPPDLNMGGSSSRERAWAPDYGGEVSSLRKYVHSVDKEVLSLRDYVHDVIAQGHRVVTLDVDLVKARVGKLESTIKTIEAWQKVADRKLVRVEKSCKHMVLIMGGVALVVVIAITVHTAYVVAKVNKQEEMLKRVQEEQDAQHRAQPTNQPSITQEPAASAAGQGRGYRARPAGRPAEQQPAHTFNPAVSHTGCEITEDRLWWSQ